MGHLQNANLILSLFCLIHTHAHTHTHFIHYTKPCDVPSHVQPFSSNHESTFKKNKIYYMLYICSFLISMFSVWLNHYNVKINQNYWAPFVLHNYMPCQGIKCKPSRLPWKLPMLSLYSTMTNKIDPLERYCLIHYKPWLCS